MVEIDKKNFSKEWFISWKNIDKSMGKKLLLSKKLIYSLILKTYESITSCRDKKFLI